MSLGLGLGSIIRLVPPALLRAEDLSVSPSLRLGSVVRLVPPALLGAEDLCVTWLMIGWCYWIGTSHFVERGRAPLLNGLCV